MEKMETDQDYMLAIRTGDPVLLKGIYRRYFPMVRDLVGNLGGSEEDAKDVFQDALMVLFKFAQEPDFKLSSKFSTLLYSVSRNIWLTRIKKKSHSEVMIPEDAKYIADELPEFDLLKMERQALYDKAFAQLGEDCQELLLMFFQKKSMAEIGKAMGYDGETYAPRRKHTCKERLVDLIKSQPEFKELCHF